MPAVVVNPVGLKDPLQLRIQITSVCVELGWQPPLWLQTTIDDPGKGQTAAALAAGADVVLACGGDGTVRHVAQVLAGSGTPMGLLPTGTANLLARNLAIARRDLVAATRIALSGKTRAIDVGWVLIDDRADEHIFLVMAGMGFDAAMMADTTEGMKRFAGWPAYVVSGLRHLRDPVMHLRMRIDDGPTLRRSARTVLVGNVGQLEGGLELLPDAAADDGLLDVVVVAPRTLGDWLRVAYRVARHRGRDRHLERFQGHTISIAADRVVPRQIDGEVIDEGQRIDVHVEPGALVVRVPQSAAAAA